MSDFVTPWTAARQASLSFTISWSLPKFMFIELVMLSNNIILCLPSPFAYNLSQHQGLFQWSTLYIRWPKYWSFTFSINPSNEYSGLISLRIEGFDLNGQGTLKSLLQHHSSKASILQCSSFLMVQLSHLYMTTGKNTVWLCESLLAKWCPCFLICCLDLSELSFQGANVF